MKKFLILILLLFSLPVYAQSTERISPPGDTAKPGNERSTAMQTANPDYQYYGILNHDWKTKDGEFSVTVRDGGFTLRTPYGGELQSRFAVALPSDGSAGVSGPVIVALPDRLVVHDGEEFALLPRDRAVYNPDGNEVFRLVKFWYGAGTLHADLVWLAENRRLELDFVQGKVEAEKLPEGVDAWKCRSCGRVNKGGKFCPECGDRRP
jgi:hypothetical protein